VTTVRVTKQTAVTFTGPITLGDPRRFVEQCNGVEDRASVNVKHHDATDQRDDTYTTITVEGAA